MASFEIKTADIKQFRLDPKNPRLGRIALREGWDQPQILSEMQTWAPEELAVSFLESGFWPQEAVLCIEEDLDDGHSLTVIEGNRRIAALISLQDALEGTPHKRSWTKYVEEEGAEAQLHSILKAIPYIIMPDRDSVDAYLGFRHVTGIKEWAPAEKAQFIAHLIRGRGMSYSEVFRKIGSKTDPVRRNFVAYLILEQMDDYDEVDIEAVESRFSLLFMSLREAKIREFLGVNLEEAPAKDHHPIPDGYQENLRDYTLWLFGNDKTAPVVPESREMSKFAVILASTEAVKYLRATDPRRVDFEKAYQLSGGEQDEVLDLLKGASYNLESALSTVHLYRKDEEVRRISTRITEHAKQLQQVLANDGPSDDD